MGRKDLENDHKIAAFFHTLHAIEELSLAVKLLADKIDQK
jgi:hypothetical protein